MSMDLVKQGKTCDIYRISDYPGILFFHRTNRFSLDGQVFQGDIPYKGLILTQMSLEWMKFLEQRGIVSNHLISSDAKSLINYGIPSNFFGSIIAAKACIPIPLQCIVRGYYVSESKSWEPYKTSSNMYGNRLPPGLKESEILPKPIYTPAIKLTTIGKSHENISFEKSIDVIENFLLKHFILDTQTDVKSLSTKIAHWLEHVSIMTYCTVHDYALSKGIVLSDTKLEFGILREKDGTWQIILIDEAFTPDSSRYWNAYTYSVGNVQISMDKQYLHHYIYSSLNLDGNSTPPKIKSDVQMQLSDIYCNLYQRLFEKDIITLTEDLSWEWKNAEDQRNNDQMYKEIENYFFSA